MANFTCTLREPRKVDTRLHHVEFTCSLRDLYVGKTMNIVRQEDVDQGWAALLDGAGEPGDRDDYSGKKRKPARAKMHERGWRSRAPLPITQLALWLPQKLRFALRHRLVFRPRRL